MHPTLDVWARWNREAITRLAKAIGQASRIWATRLPYMSVTWFDEKAAHVAGVAIPECAACGFGSGEIAVAPSGNLYPCERLIGADEEGNPMRLAGHVLDGGKDFLEVAEAPERSAPACEHCELAPACNTTCQCSNYVRTGRVDRPDLLLCVAEKACFVETRRVLEKVSMTG